MLEHEPGVGGALTDAAVGDDLIRLADSGLFGVDLLQLGPGLEGAVLVGGLAPGHVGRGGDVATAQCAFAFEAGSNGHLAGVLRC